VLYTMVTTRLRAMSRATFAAVGAVVLLALTVFGWRRVRSVD
jgi:hypothetical protein